MIYQTLIRVLSPVIIFWSFIDGIKRKAEWNFVIQRLGFSQAWPKKLPTNQLPKVWVHCASVGEVKAATPLINSLNQSAQFVITTNTVTGKLVAQQQIKNAYWVGYCPLDYPSVIKRFLKHTQPQHLWIIETEIWPNIYQICHKRGISIHIVNGRISSKTLSAPNWLKKSYKQSLLSTNKILARSHEDGEAFIRLGANKQQVKTLGNLKFSHTSDSQCYEKRFNREYVLLASSHEQEELNITRTWLMLNRHELLVIVPRHPNRKKHIEATLSKENCAQQAHSDKRPLSAGTQVWIDDQIGQLQPLFEHAKLVIMGGSFVNVGGHNLIEPAQYKKPIITGPYMQNFKEETQLLHSFNALEQVNNYTELELVIKKLLTDNNYRHKLGINAFNAVKSQQNVLQRYQEILTTTLL